MKKSLVILLSLLMVLSMAFAACSKSEDQSASEDQTAADQTVDDSSKELEGMLPDDVLDMNGPLVVISTEGIGNIARTVEGTDLVFDDEYPPSQIIDHLVKGTTLTIGAKPTEDDWEFVKWTVNGEDYSTDEQITVTADEDLQIVAVFEFKE
jgi:hypothetical protein